MSRCVIALLMVLPALAIQGADAVRAGWVVSSMEQPESVYYDQDSGFIFVSNMVGNATQKDGRGWISKLDGTGKVIQPKWVDGLDAPRGIRIRRGVLWVTNITEVVAINVKSGAIVRRIPIPDSKFLNDTAIGQDGTVYVSDTQGNRIYSVVRERVSVWAEGEQLEAPNGLLAEKTRLIVGGNGKVTPKGYEGPGNLFALDLVTKQKTVISQKPIGFVDGVESDGAGGWIVTNASNGEILQVKKDGTTHLLRTFENGAFDHAYLPLSRIAIVPHRDGTVGSYHLTLP